MRHYHLGDTMNKKHKIEKIEDFGNGIFIIWHI